jgi:hypothetical protein
MFLVTLRIFTGLSATILKEIGVGQAPRTTVPSAFSDDTCARGQSPIAGPPHNLGPERSVRLTSDTPPPLSEPSGRRATSKASTVSCIRTSGFGVEVMIEDEFSWDSTAVG